MAGFLFATHAASAHVSPLIPVARALVRDGHRVDWYTGVAHRDRIERSGARYVPPRHGRFLDFEELETTHPEITTMTPAGRAAWFLRTVWAQPCEGQFRDLLEIHERTGADVLVADSGFWAANLFHEVTGGLWATVCQSPMSIPDASLPPYGNGWQPGTSAWHRRRDRRGHQENLRSVFGPAAELLGRTRAVLGLPPARGQRPTPYLFLQTTVPAFEYPRAGLPPQVHFTGPLQPDPPPAAGPPGWWAELATDRPVVLVTQGTSARQPGELIDPALAALAGENLLVVVAGRPGGTVPANARVAPMLPYADLMPRLAAVVTNGGYGTVQQALGHGLPLVVTGLTEDKPEVCARVAWSGAGLDLRSRHPAPRRIRTAVRAVLDDPSYRAAASRIAGDMAAYDGTSLATALLEELANTRGPVLAREVSRL